MNKEKTEGLALTLVEDLSRYGLSIAFVSLATLLCATGIRQILIISFRSELTTLEDIRIAWFSLSLAVTLYVISIIAALAASRKEKE